MKVEIPLRITSTLNQRRHYFADWKISKLQRETARMFVSSALVGKSLPQKPWIIWITRYGKKELDSDNLVGSLKAIRDGVADGLGLKSDKDSPELCWRYGQQKNSEYKVEVELLGKIFPSIDNARR